MKYDNIKKGIFLQRPNRFLAKVLIDGQEELVHVKNTGRCRELLIPGAVIYLEDHRYAMGKRKTEFSLIAVEKKLDKPMLVNMDSQVPNKVVWEGLTEGRIQLPGMGPLIQIRQEVKYGASRFDLAAEDEAGQKALIEVKGVTLEYNGVAAFPDAPTERGLKHIMELCKALNDGFCCYIIFLIQMKGVDSFVPNDATHKAFGDGLRHGADCGVNILAYDALVTPESIIVDQPVPVKI